MAFFSIKETAQTKEAQESENKDIPIKYNSQWKEIIRTMNTQKAMTTVSQNRYDQDKAYVDFEAL